MILTLRSLLVPAVCLAIGTSSASAYTYQYTGNYYQHAKSPFTTSMEITATVNVREEIPPNYKGQVRIKSYKISDGVDIFTRKQDCCAVRLYVKTDKSGAIESWNLRLDFMNAVMTGSVKSINNAGRAEDKVVWCDTLHGGCRRMARNNETPGGWTAGARRLNRF